MDSDYFLKTITNLVEASLQVETIEKTFRRPAAFITLPYSSFEVYAAKTGSKLAPEPFKQK